MSDLSPRQQEVAYLIATKGMSAKAIARELGISRKTVEAHIHKAASRIDLPHGPRMRLAVWFWSRTIDRAA